MLYKSAPISYWKWGLVFAGLLLVFLWLTFGTGKAEGKYVNPPKFTGSTELPLIQISIKERYFNKIEKKRKKALALGILETSSEDFVPAVVTYEGESYPASIRLKGDWVDHLEGVKWSYRVKLKGGKTIMGMRKFSLHHPKTRGYINEWLYHKMAKNVGIIGLRYSFVEGVLHVRKPNSIAFQTTPLGIYALEESFEKRTIESNRRKEGVILKMSEAYYWNEIKQSILVAKQTGADWGTFMDFTLIREAKYPITMFSQEKYLNDPVFRKQFRLGKELLDGVTTDKYSIDEVFDVRQLAWNNVVMNLLGAIHNRFTINLRFYYNPTTSLLEPIPFDGNAGELIPEYMHYGFYKEGRDVLYREALIEVLEVASQKEFLSDFLTRNNPNIEMYNSLMTDEFGDVHWKPEVFEKNREILAQELARLKPL